MTYAYIFVYTAILLGKPGLSDCSLDILTRGFGVKFNGPETLPDATNKNAMDFNFSV